MASEDIEYQEQTFKQMPTATYRLTKALYFGPACVFHKGACSDCRRHISQQNNYRNITLSARWMNQHGHYSSCPLGFVNSNIGITRCQCT